MRIICLSYLFLYFTTIVCVCLTIFITSLIALFRWHFSDHSYNSFILMALFPVLVITALIEAGKMPSGKPPCGKMPSWFGNFFYFWQYEFRRLRKNFGWGKHFSDRIAVFSAHFRHLGKKWRWKMLLNGTFPPDFTLTMVWRGYKVPGLLQSCFFFII